MKNVAAPVFSAIISTLMMTGCASGLDRQTVMTPKRNLSILEADNAESARTDTTPYPALDRLESIVEWPAKRLGRRDSMAETPGDCLSESSAELLEKYFEANEVGELNVSSNEYSPVESLRRLRNNGHVGAHWRYTVGLVSWTAGAIVPNRVLDRTVYNPFTNTLEINSDDPLQLLVAASQAHRLKQSRHAGLHAVASVLPVLGNLGRINAAKEISSFASNDENWELECAADRAIYKESSMTVTMAAAPFLPVYVMPVFAVGGTFVGDRLAESKSRAKRRARAEIEDHVQYSDEGIVLVE